MQVQFGACPDLRPEACEHLGVSASGYNRVQLKFTDFQFVIRARSYPGSRL